MVFECSSFFTVRILAISRFALLLGVSEGYIRVKMSLEAASAAIFIFFMSNFTPGLNQTVEDGVDWSDETVHLTLDCIREATRALLPPELLEELLHFR